MISAPEITLLLNANGPALEERVESLSQLLADGSLRFDDHGNVHITAQG
jgi:hypothetical protein